METADKLFEKAKRLKPEDLSDLIARLTEYISSPSPEAGSKHGHSYARSIALSGIADSDWSDVSSSKGRHLADAYGPGRNG
jgi:hypothetical protein